jgi:hypothetical protein
MCRVVVCDSVIWRLVVLAITNMRPLARRCAAPAVWRVVLATLKDASLAARRPVARAVQSRYHVPSLYQPTFSRAFDRIGVRPHRRPDEIGGLGTGVRRTGDWGDVKRENRLLLLLAPFFAS